MPHAAVQSLIPATITHAQSARQDSAISAENSQVASGDEIHPIRAVNSSLVPPYIPSGPAYDDGWKRLRDVEPDIVTLEDDLEHVACSIDQVNHRGDALVVKGRALRMPEKQPAQRHLCQRLGMPADYVPKLPAAIQAELVNHHVREFYSANQMTGPDALVLYARKGEFLGLARSDLLTLSCKTLLEAVRQGVGGADAGTLLTRPAARFDDEVVRIDLINKVNAFEVRAGDILCSGLHIDHSLVGDFATTVQQYVVRMVCNNGLTRRECLGMKKAPRIRRQSKIQDDGQDILFDQVRRITETAWKGLPRVVEAIMQLQDKPFSHDQLRTFMQYARMNSGGVWREVEAAWQRERELGDTAYRALNALTWAATHAQELSARQRTALSQLGGVFAMMDVHYCDRCGRLTATD